MLKDGIQKCITNQKRKELLSNKLKKPNISNILKYEILDPLNEEIEYKNDEVEIDAETKYLMKYVRELEDFIVILSKNLVDLKNKEVERISKEFITNNYGRSFNTTIETVISSIVGKSNLDFELEKYYLMKKTYLEASILVHSNAKFEKFNI